MSLKESIENFIHSMAEGWVTSQKAKLIQQCRETGKADAEEGKPLPSDEKIKEWLDNAGVPGDLGYPCRSAYKEGYHSV